MQRNTTAARRAVLALVIGPALLAAQAKATSDSTRFKRDSLETVVASKPTLYVAVFPGLPSPINSGDYLLTFHDSITKAIIGNPVPVAPPVLNGSVPRYLLAVIQ